MKRLINDDEQMHNVNILYQKVTASMTSKQLEKINAYREAKDLKKEIQLKSGFLSKGGEL